MATLQYLRGLEAEEMSLRGHAETHRGETPEPGWVHTSECLRRDLARLAAIRTKLDEGWAARRTMPVGAE